MGLRGSGLDGPANRASMHEGTDPAVQLAIARFQTQVPRFRDEFRGQLAQLRERLAQRGVLRSSMLVDGVQAAVKEEMRRRIFAACDCVLESLDSDWAPTEAEAEDAFSRCFQANDYRKFHHTDLTDVVSAAARATGIVYTQNRLNELELSVSQVQVDAYSESVAAIKMAARKRKAERSVNIHNHGNVGAMQIGDHNNAHVLQNVEGANAALIDALAKLRQELAKRPNAAAIDVLCEQTANEVQAAGISEKARGMLGGIAQLVQTVGAVPGAYPLLVAAAHAAGVTLPALPTS
jgi:hypothetical protein